MFHPKPWLTQYSETTFEANVKPSLDRHIIERRIQLYGFPLRVRLCACMRLSVATVFCCFVLSMVCVRRLWDLYGAYFLVPTFFPRLSNSVGEKMLGTTFWSRLFEALWGFCVEQYSWSVPEHSRNSCTLWGIRPMKITIEVTEMQ